MIKNLIFDFDGVLVDSEMLVGKSFSRYLGSLGHEFDEKDFAKFAGKKTIQIVEILSKKLSIKDSNKFFNDIMSIGLDIYRNELTIVIGAYEYVTNSKYNLFIGSNNQKKRIIDGLKTVKLDKYFKPERIYSFDLVDRPKPHPDIYLKVIDENKLNKKETIIIEDSVVGVNAGVSAGIKVIGLTAGGHWYENRDEKELLDAGAFVVTDDYKQITEIIKSQ